MSQSFLGQLTGDTEVLYRHLLRSERATIQDHAAALGWTRSKAVRRLAALERLRLIHVGEGEQVIADPPRISLARLIEAEETGLDQRRQDLLVARGAVEDYEDDFQRGLEHGGPSTAPWERVRAAEVPELIERLAHETDGPVRQATLTLARGRRHLEAVRRVREQLQWRGCEQQSVFPLQVLQDPDWRPVAEARAAAGERQRYLDSVPMEFMLFGDDAALLVDEETSDRAPAMLLIRSAPVRYVLLALFEELWRRADPVHEGGAAATDLKLLELLALGFKDEAIARHLGMGLRTVRRRVAGLMDEHGVDTRFQLGLAVARRGLLE